jgi:hypothetical protein
MRADFGPCPQDRDGRAAWELANAIACENTREILKRIVLNVPVFSNPRGMLRMDYIQRVIVETYNMMGYGDLKSDVKEKTHGDLQDFMMSLLSDRLDFEAQTVMRAIKGFGTDEATLITILCTLAEEDILPLQMAFSSRYEKSMEQAVLSETSGKFKRVLLLAGCDGVGESYAKVINSAVAGLGTDTKAIIRLMVTATPEQLDATREAYSRIYKKDLIRAVGSEWKVRGDFKRIIEALAKRHPANVNDDADIDYSADVRAMRNAVEGMGTDEAAVIALLANKSHKQIEAFREAYKIETGELLRERIRNETTGLFESKLFRETLMGLLTPREEQIAIYLGEAMAGWGNDDWGLISMLVHRTEEEKMAIRTKYTEHFGGDLIADIRSNCRGDYEDALVACISPKARTLARGIRKCISGWFSSTNKTGLMALMTHKDDLMPILRKEFEKEYNGKTLQGVIKKECAGEFEAALVSLASYTPPKGAKPLGPDDEVPPPPESPRRRNPSATAPPRRRNPSATAPPRRRKPCTSRRHPLATPPAGTPRNRPRVKIRGNRAAFRRVGAVLNKNSSSVIQPPSARASRHSSPRAIAALDRCRLRRAARARPSRCVARVVSRDAATSRFDRANARATPESDVATRARRED